MTAVGDDNGLGGPAGAGSDLLDVLDNVQSFDDLSEHDMLSVEPLCLLRANEELRSVGSGTGVRHGEDAGTGVLLHEVLVGELGAINRLAAGSVSGGEVATLTHETRDHAVEGRALVVEGLAAPPYALLAGAKRAEVLGGAGSDVGVELHHDAASRLTADGHVEEDLRVRHSCCREEKRK